MGIKKIKVEKKALPPEPPPSVDQHNKQLFAYLFSIKTLLHEAVLTFNKRKEF